MSIFQIISTLFALFMLYVVTIHKSRSKLTASEVAIWYALWSFFIILALFPHLLIGIATILKFERVFDLLVVGAFMVLSVVVFMSYFQQRANNRKLEEFVRLEAMQKKQSEKKLQ